MADTADPTAEAFILERLSESDEPVKAKQLAADAPVSYGRLRQVLSDMARRREIVRPRDKEGKPIRGYYTLPQGKRKGTDRMGSEPYPDVQEPYFQANAQEGSRMEVPRQQARAVAFPEAAEPEADAPPDHPHLSTIAYHPDYELVGDDGFVRFRVSLHVEAAPTRRRRSKMGRAG